MAAGAVFALLCWLRPPFLVCVPLLLFLSERKKILTGYFFSFAILLIIVFVCIPVEVWKDYFSSIQEWSRFQLQTMTTVPGSVSPVIPSVIEGETNLGLMRDFLQNNRSVQGNVKGLFDTALDTGQLAMMFLFVVGVLSFLLFRRFKRGEFILKTEHLFIFIFLLYMLTEYFSPAPSYSYHYIQWIVPVLICLSAPTFRVGFPEVVVAAGLAMNLGAVSFIPYSLLIGEGMLFAGIYLFSSDRNRWF